MHDHAGADFVRSIFGLTTHCPVFLTSLPNGKNGAPSEAPRQMITRDVGEITQFCQRWDRPKRGLFFCVGTLREGTNRRAKENIAEIVGLHSDIDLKSIELGLEDVLVKLDSLRLLPSYVVSSGHGLHAYWLFREGLPADEADAQVEAALRQLADLLGGDMAVCEISRLMRLPGTHNTKDGEFSEVCVVRDNPAARYELEELEEWLAETSPVIRRRVALAEDAAATVPRNPFLVVADRLGFKPPIDVEQRLTAMTYQGPGDSSIHQTQLQVSASLLRRGQSPDEIVEILLDATRAAVGPSGAHWNWVREEKTLFGMCESWLKKSPETRAAVTSAAAEVTAEPEPVKAVPEGTVLQFKQKPKPKEKSSGVMHIKLGRLVVDVMEQRGERVLFTNEASYRYCDGLWSLEIAKTLKPWLDRRIEEACRELSVDSSNRVINETREWIVRNPDLYRANVVFDDHGMVPTLTGLLDPQGGEIIPAAPEHYTTWRVPVAYDPKATCPLWLQMLADMFAERPPDTLAQTIALLQELLGMGLIDAKAKGLSKALVLWGPQDSGKSGALEVMAGLYGGARNTTALRALDDKHGTTGFVERRPWLLHEAFEQSVWHLTSIVKAIISGDEIDIDIKFGPRLSQRVTSPILWGTNHSPSFRDAGKAVIDRLVILPCRQNFPQDDPRGVALLAQQQGYGRPHELVLATELPGLLAWAMDGLRRALARGAFALPPEATIAARDVRLDSNPVAEFVEDCITFDPDRMVGTTDFNAAFTSWWEDHRGEDDKGPRPERIRKLLLSLGDQRIASDRKELRDMKRRYYAGIILNEEGVRRWKTIVQSDAFLRPGRNASTTPPEDNVNRGIPSEWSGKLVVRVMRAAHAGGGHNNQGPKAGHVTTEDDGQAWSSPGSSTQVVEESKEPRF